VWADDRLVAFDTETSSADPYNARIVSAAMLFVGNGQPTVEHKWLLKVDIDIEPGATEVHGITTEYANEHGQDRNAAIREIVAMLELCRIVVIYNARFDLTVLNRECQRLGITPLSLERVRVVDPLVIDRHLDKFRKGSRKLADVCRHYGIDLTSAHDASNDALAAVRLAWVLGKRGNITRRYGAYENGHFRVIPERKAEYDRLVRQWDHCCEDLDALHFAQQLWAKEQEVSLREYKLKRGEPYDGSPEWPVVLQDPVDSLA
jgi:DNA polymerase-3 subunit epsilon